MAADLQLSNDGIRYAGGTVLDIKSAMPASGTYTAGDIVLESTPQGRVSGWKRVTTGTAHVLGVDWVYFAGLQSGAVVPTTSGTAIDLTGIPPGVRRLTLSVDSVSTNGTSFWLIQLGAGSVQTSGYLGAGSINNSGSMAAAQFTAGFGVYSSAAANILSGQISFSALNASAGLWVCQGSLASSSGPVVQTTAGSKVLAGVLDRLRLTTTLGTDTFDGGSISLMWE